MTYIPGIKSALGGGGGGGPFTFATLDNTLGPIFVIPRTGPQMYLRVGGAFDFGFLALPASPTDNDEILLRFEGDGTGFRECVVTDANQFDGSDFVGLISSWALRLIESDVLHIKYSAAQTKWVVLYHASPRGPKAHRYQRQTLTAMSSQANHVLIADVTQFTASPYVTFTGFEAPVGGVSRVLHLLGDSTTNVELLHLDALSASANQINLGAFAPSLTAKSIVLVYGVQSQRWEMVSYYS